MDKFEQGFYVSQSVNSSSKSGGILCACSWTNPGWRDSNHLQMASPPALQSRLPTVLPSEMLPCLWHPMPPSLVIPLLHSHLPIPQPTGSSARLHIPPSAVPAYHTALVVLNHNKNKVFPSDNSEEQIPLYSRVGTKI